MKSLIKKAVCTLLASMVVLGASISSYAAQDVERVGAFVERCYSVILGRHSDADGYQYWLNGLLSGERSGITCAYGFVFSKEYKSKNKSDVDYLTDLYRTFLDREPDEGGLAYWSNRLANGEDDCSVIFNGFACSKEFVNLCNMYGIISGDAIGFTNSARYEKPSSSSGTGIPAQSEGSTSNQTFIISTPNGPVSVTGHFDADRENEILNQVNAHRAANGLAPLTMTDDLRQAARQRAIELSYYFNHSRPDGGRCFDLFPDTYGYKAENIAAGRTTADGVMSDWKGSSGHNSNMLNPNYTSIGIGCFVCTEGDNSANLNQYAYTNYYTQEFGG